MILRIPFSDIIKRDERIYDYAELPRLLALSTCKDTEQLLCKEFRIYVMKKENKRWRRKPFIISLSGVNITIKPEKDKKSKERLIASLEISEIKEYIENTICNIKDPSCIEINSKVHTYSAILLLSRNNLQFYTAKGAKEYYPIDLHDFKLTILDKQISEMLCPPATWIRGLLRYALTKVITVYVLREVFNGGPQRTFNYLMCLSRLLKHDDEAVIFRIPKPLVWLPSLIFGAGGLKGILEVRESDVGLSGMCSYELNLNASNIISLNVFAKLINDVCGDVIPLNNTLDVFKCLISIFSIVSAAMGVSIPYLKGPLIPPTARYRDIKAKGHPTPQVALKVPDISMSIEEIVRRGDLILEGYSKYLVRRAELI